MKTRAQVGMEFLIIFGVIMVLATIFLLALNVQSDVFEGTKVYLSLRDTGRDVQSELVLAASVHSGYLRSFEVPEEIAGRDYSINITGNVLVLLADDYEASFDVPIVQGNIQKGTNNVRKIGGVVYLN